MALFQDRQRAFETKFAHEHELQFRTIAQRNRLLAEWVTRLAGMPEDAAEEYQRALVSVAVDNPDLHALVARVGSDLQEKGHTVPRRALQQKVEELAALARQQVYQGIPT